MTQLHGEESPQIDAPRITTQDKTSFVSLTVRTNLKKKCGALLNLYQVRDTCEE